MIPNPNPNYLKFNRTLVKHEIPSLSLTTLLNLTSKFCVLMVSRMANHIEWFVTLSFFRFVISGFDNDLNRLIQDKESVLIVTELCCGHT